MLRICYADNELDIEGTNQDFRDLQSAIRQVISLKEQSGVVIQCDVDFDPSPYEIRCKQLLIQVKSGPNQFLVSNDALQIIGSSDALLNLSENFPIDADCDVRNSIRYHIHYDVISFPEYVSSNSPSVTLSLRQDN